MAKKNKERCIEVKNPKIGQSYRFKFAGTIMYGPIIEIIEDLSASMGCKYYWMVEENPAYNALSPKGAKPTKYPISIYSILKDKKDV